MLHECPLDLPPCAEESIQKAAKGMESNLKRATVAGPGEAKLPEGLSSEVTVHPVASKLKEITNINEMEKASLESLTDKIHSYENSFEELKVRPTVEALPAGVGRGWPRKPRWTSQH